jgi:hypothetical protein
MPAYIISDEDLALLCNRLTDIVAQLPDTTG